MGGFIPGDGIGAGSGGGGTPDNTTNERIPYKNVSEFDDSPLYYDVSEEKVVSDVTLEVPPGTIIIGETTDLSACTGSLIVTDQVNSKYKYLIESEFDTSGSTPPVYLDLDSEFVLNIQTDFSQTLTSNPLNYSITGTVVAPSVRQINTTTFKTGAILTNLRARFIDNATGVVMRYVPSKAEWDANTGVTTISGDNLFNFLSDAADSPGVFNLGINPFIVENGQQINIEIAADSINILGDLSGDPYQIANVQDGAYETIEGDVTGAGSSVASTFPIWTNTSGSALSAQSDFSFVGAPLYANVHIKPPSSSGSAGFVFDNTGGNVRGTFAYGQFGNELIFTVAAATAGGLRFVNNSAGNTVFDIQNTDTVIEIVGINHEDDHPLLRFATSDGAADIHIGTDTPVGSISTTGGTFYFRDDELNTNIYMKRSAGGASTSGWTVVGDVSGAGESVNNSLATWDGTGGDNIQSVVNAILTDDGTNLLLALHTPDNGGLAEIIIYDDDSNERIKISHNDGGASPDSTQIYMEALVNEIVGSGIEFTIRADNGDLLLHADTADKSVELKSAGADTNPVIKIEAEGTNGVEVDFYTGDRTPVGNITANPGDYYFRSSGATSDIYIHTGASSDNTSWVDILASSAGTGDVVGPSGSVNRAIAVFDGISGKLLDDVASAKILVSGNNTTLELEAISVSGSANILLFDNTPTLQAILGYNKGNDVLNILCVDGGEILIESDTDLTLKTNQASTNPTLKIENFTEAIELYINPANPNGTTTTPEGSLVVDTSAGEAQLYQRHGTGDGNSYAQVEFFQKIYTNVSTTSTLSRDYNRILLNPTSDIAVSIPTHANTAQAKGFEQQLIKTVSNNNIITIPSPGFISGSGNYVLSRQGDYVKYLQTTSANIIVGERRDVYAAMSFSGSESIDGGGSSVDVEIDIFTSNDHFYYGLCEPNYAQNRIDFPDVEDLSNGDLYEVKVNIVAKWEKDYDVFFKSSVYDKGIWYDYPIHIYETSDSDSDYQQLNGQGTFRTGLNATAPGLSTYLTLVMRLSSNADITFKSINMHISKLRG